MVKWKMFRRVGTLVLTLRITQYSKFNRQEIIIPWTQTLLVEIVRAFSKALKQTSTLEIRIFHRLRLMKVRAPHTTCIQILRGVRIRWKWWISRLMKSLNRIICSDTRKIRKKKMNRKTIENLNLKRFATMDQPSSATTKWAIALIQLCKIK